MQIYEELIARGLIAQVTNEDEIKKMVNEGRATFYIGFDPTADSLHVGHFMSLCLMKRLQMAGNRPIALLGGGTGMIGDPSGRTDMRQMMTVETIEHNCDCFKKQMSRFIDFSDGKALMVNNAEWLMDLNYVQLLREVGPHFSVNRMLTAECYKQRMERGLSFLEFNYMIMQSYEFYQYWRNVADADVLKCLRMLTFLPLEKIDEMDQWEGSQLNTAKEILAFELTNLVHGQEEAEKAKEAARAIFTGGSAADMPTAELTEDDFNGDAIDLLAILQKSGLAPSRSEARRNVEQGGVSVDGAQVKDIKAVYTKAQLSGDGIVVKRGKKNFKRVVLK